jgi:hypothetical protein
VRARFALGIPALVASIVLVGSIANAGDAVPSGLKPGEIINPFDVEDVTGPNKGTTLCYR